MKNQFINFSSLIFVLCIVFGCQEKTPIEIIDPEPNNEDSLQLDYELLWEIPIRKDTISDAGIRTMLNGNELYFSRTLEGLGSLALNDELVCVNKKTGEELWSWYNENNGDFTDPVLNDNIIAFENRNRYYILDRLTGDILSQGAVFEGDLKVLKESGLNTLIANIAFGSGPDNYRNKIIEINKETGQLDTILDRVKDDKFSHYLSHPQLSINENGDTILLYFYSRKIWSPVDLHMDFIKYNLTQDTIDWMLRDFDYENSSGTVTPPIILNDKIYVHTVRSIYCFDLATGVEIWRREYLYTNFIFTNFIINDNILNTISDEGHLIGINIDTGEELYNNDYGAYSKGITFYKDRLYYASEYIFIVDYRTGELLHKLKSSNAKRGDFFINKIAIDEENEVMYAQDGSFMQAIKIPD